MFDDIRTGAAEGYTCESSLTEFYYKTCERFGREVAELRHTSLRNTNLSVIPVDENLTRIAGVMKCLHRGKLSLADAYIMAVAKAFKGTLITTDSRIAELKLVPTKLLHIT